MTTAPDTLRSGAADSARALEGSAHTRVNIQDVYARGNVTILVAPPALPSGDVTELVEALLPARGRTVRDAAQVSDQTSVPDPIEELLDREVDGYRDLLTSGQVKVALDLLMKRLRSMPASSSGRIIFRVKANIGNCYLQLGDEKEAQRWLSEAYDSAPNEPKAIANKALALIVGGRSQESFDFCREALRRDPANEHAAAHLLLAAIPLGIDDPATLIPSALLEREEVVLFRIVFLRGREKRPDWWQLAARASADFPQNERICFFGSEAVVDEVTRDPTFRATRKIAPGWRERVSCAAALFEARWERAKQGDVPHGDIGISALGDAMLARQVLGDCEVAVELARELIARTNDHDLLSNAIQVLLSSRQQELALQAIAKLDGSPEAKFLHGMIHLERGEWSEAAASFQVASVPEPEKGIVATVIALAPLRVAGAVVDAQSFETSMKAAEGQPRCLILVARTAQTFGVPEVASEAFAAALTLLGEKSTLAERSMVAAYAAADRNYTSVIQVLEGYIEQERPSEELVWLAEAHALEHPPRRRNLDFFERLPAAVRNLDEIASLRASTLMRAGRYDQAEELFRLLLRKKPRDPFPLLGVVEALRRLGNESQVAPIVLAVDENSMGGQLEHRTQLAHLLKQCGAFDRALRYAYSLFREAPNNAKVVLGYVSLILGDKSQSIVPEVHSVATECWVKIQNKDGETDDFIIDKEPSFFGIDIRSPEHPSSKRVLGLKIGDEIEVERGPIPAEHWKVVELKSKFIHLLHVAMEQFEQKFPDAKAMWRLTIRNNDVSTVFDIVRQSAEANRERAKWYTEKPVPLAFVARMLGGDPPSFAEYVRGLGSHIVTCTGRDDEFASAGSIAAEARTQGAVLDMYTAWVAAEIGLLADLRSWFGRLLTPQSTIDEIDTMIAHQEEGRGREMMTVAWHNGQFYRHDVKDEFINSQVAALRAIKETVLEHCDVLTLLLPNDLSEFSIKILERFGVHSLDPAYLSHSEGMILLSDDLRYREVARIAAGVSGVWLQVVLNKALQVGAILRSRVIEAYLGLAARRHTHLRLDSGILCDVYDRCGDTDLKELDVISEYIGTQGADMRAHALVTGQFLATLWVDNAPDAKVEAATSMILNKLLRFRYGDKLSWLASLLRIVPSTAFAQYVEKIRRDIRHGQRIVETYPRAVLVRSRLTDQVSSIALRAAGVI